MKKIYKFFRKLFGKCYYCRKPLRLSGRGFGVPHHIYLIDKNGWPTKKQKTVYACLRCEIEFDDE